MSKTFEIYQRVKIERGGHAHLVEGWKSEWVGKRGTVTMVDHPLGDNPTYGVLVDGGLGYGSGFTHFQLRGLKWWERAWEKMFGRKKALPK